MTDLKQARATIRAEAYALDLLAASLDDRFSKAVTALLCSTGKIVLTGIGKSGHVARKLAATLASTSRPAVFVHPSEAVHGDMGMIVVPDCIIALSNSGETEEIRPVFNYADRFGLTTVLITSRADSSLAGRAHHVIELPDVEEGCPLNLAPMASAVMMMAAGHAIAAELMVLTGTTPQDFYSVHHGGYLGAMLSEVA